jgi:acyl-CoA dehydrogenase
MAQVIPTPYADVSAQTMLPTSHLVWSALWSGIATDAGRPGTRLRPRRGAPKGGAPAMRWRLAEAASLLQLMKSNVVAALRQYEAALGSEDRLSSLAFRRRDEQPQDRQLADGGAGHQPCAC